ncbi:MAG: hypothetical protein QXG05_07295 [Nitrososphaerota archaeon]
MFTDGNKFYWRLKYFDGDNETNLFYRIIEMIMKGQTENRVEMMTTLG